MNCGLLYQYTSCPSQEGRALRLDCRHLTSCAAVVPPDVRVVICDTRATCELTGSEYGRRRAQREEGVRRLARFYPSISAVRDVTLAQFEAHERDLPPVVARRARFIVEENARVLQLAGALPVGVTGPPCGRSRPRRTRVRAPCPRSARLR